MTRDEAVKVLEEVIDDMRGEYTATEIQLQDWGHNLQLVFQGLDEGWE